MDTLSATPTPAADERLADLERQMAELRAQFDVLAAGAEHFFEAGRASISNPTRPQELFRHPRHLHVVTTGGER